MTVAQDHRAINVALKEVPVSEGQWAMVWLLYHAETGADNVFEYIHSPEPRGLLLWQQTVHYR